MRVEITPKENLKIRILWNGVQVKEDDVPAGTEYKLALELPKENGGTAQVIAVKEDGTEIPLGSVTYTQDESAGDCGCDAPADQEKSGCGCEGCRCNGDCSNGCNCGDDCACKAK